MTYSSSLAMNRAANRSRFSGRNQNLVSARVQTRTLGPVSNTITLIVLACLLGLLYLTQVTKTNAYGYQINSLQQKQSQLKSEHDDLSVASAACNPSIASKTAPSPKTSSQSPPAPPSKTNSA